jgi:hypothetical protein
MVSILLKIETILIEIVYIIRMRNNSYNAPLYRMMRAKKVQKAAPIQKRVKIQKPTIMPPIVIVPQVVIAAPFFML